eukprot:1082330-Rhodomonas_salina.2
MVDKDEQVTQIYEAVDLGRIYQVGPSARTLPGFPVLTQANGSADSVGQHDLPAGYPGSLPQRRRRGSAMSNSPILVSRPACCTSLGTNMGCGGGSSLDRPLREGGHCACGLQLGDSDPPQPGARQGRGSDPPPQPRGFCGDGQVAPESDAPPPPLLPAPRAPLSLRAHGAAARGSGARVGGAAAQCSVS